MDDGMDERMLDEVRERRANRCGIPLHPQPDFTGMFWDDVNQCFVFNPPDGKPLYRQPPVEENYGLPYAASVEASRDGKTWNETDLPVRISNAPNTPEILELLQSAHQKQNEQDDDDDAKPA